jgi:hypothetical protein
LYALKIELLAHNSVFNTLFDHLCMGTTLLVVKVSNSANGEPKNANDFFYFFYWANQLDLLHLYFAVMGCIKGLEHESFMAPIGQKHLVILFVPQKNIQINWLS